MLLLVILLGMVVIASLLGWWLRSPIWPGLALGILIVAIVVAARGPDAGTAGLILTTGLAVLVAGTGGGPLTKLVLRLAAASTTPRTAEPGRPDPTPAEDILRGGAWIGFLERLAAATTIIAGWPEGLAVILAVKGLARYPELRSPGVGASERFIIGTFTSVLWAGASAVVVLLLLR